MQKAMCMINDIAETATLEMDGSDAAVPVIFTIFLLP